MCALLDDNGGQCGIVFDKFTALRCHQRCTEGGQHGTVITVAMAVIANQCPRCKSTFSDNMCAVKHAQNATERNMYCGQEHAGKAGS